jgi:hypothetical protein
LDAGIDGLRCGCGGTPGDIGLGLDVENGLLGLGRIGDTVMGCIDARCGCDGAPGDMRLGLAVTFAWGFGPVGDDVMDCGEVDSFTIGVDVGVAGPGDGDCGFGDGRTPWDAGDPLVGTGVAGFDEASGGCDGALEFIELGRTDRMDHGEVDFSTTGLDIGVAELVGGDCGFNDGKAPWDVGDPLVGSGVAGFDEASGGRDGALDLNGAGVASGATTGRGGVGCTSTGCVEVEPREVGYGVGENPGGGGKEQQNSRYAFHAGDLHSFGDTKSPLFPSFDNFWQVLWLPGGVLSLNDNRNDIKSVMVREVGPVILLTSCLLVPDVIIRFLTQYTLIVQAAKSDHGLTDNVIAVFNSSIFSILLMLGTRYTINDLVHPGHTINKAVFCEHNCFYVGRLSSSYLLEVRVRWTEVTWFESATRGSCNFLNP